MATAGGDVRVDDADHASLAVLALGAIEPDGLGVVDGDGVCGQLRGVGGGDGHEAGEDLTRGIALTVADWYAGLVEG